MWICRRRAGRSRRCRRRTSAACSRRCLVLTGYPWHARSGLASPCARGRGSPASRERAHSPESGPRDAHPWRSIPGAAARSKRCPYRFPAGRCSARKSPTLSPAPSATSRAAHAWCARAGRAARERPIRGRIVRSSFPHVTLFRKHSADKD